LFEREDVQLKGPDDRLRALIPGADGHIVQRVIMNFNRSLVESITPVATEPLLVNTGFFEEHRPNLRWDGFHNRMVACIERRRKGLKMKAIWAKQETQAKKYAGSCW
jgi:hypothetical protein